MFLVDSSYSKERLSSLLRLGDVTFLPTSQRVIECESRIKRWMGMFSGLYVRDVIDGNCHLGLVGSKDSIRITNTVFLWSNLCIQSEAGLDSDSFFMIAYLR